MISVTTIWTAHENSKAPRYENNFRQTNRQSLRSRATTARAQTAYRRYRGKNQLPRFDLKVQEKPIYLPEEQHPYGRPNRPGTPVGDVVSNYYGQVASAEITQKYDVLSQKKLPSVGKYTRGHTRASAMAHNYTHSENFFKMQKEDHTKLFKMSKFQNPPARTDTNNFKSKSSYFYKRPQTAKVEEQK